MTKGWLCECWLWWGIKNDGDEKIICKFGRTLRRDRKSDCCWTTSQTTSNIIIGDHNIIISRVTRNYHSHQDEYLIIIARSLSSSSSSSSSTHYYYSSRSLCLNLEKKIFEPSQWIVKTHHYTADYRQLVIYERCCKTSLKKVGVQIFLLRVPGSHQCYW